MARIPVLVLGMAFLAVAACGPSPGGGCRNVQIDWVDFVQVGSTQYVAGLDPQTTVAEAELGPVVAHVKFKLDGNVCDPGYRPKDGDAAFLDPGTPVFAVTGHPASRLLAARRNGRLVAYVAKTAG